MAAVVGIELTNVFQVGGGTSIAMMWFVFVGRRCGWFGGHVMFEGEGCLGDTAGGIVIATIHYAGRWWCLFNVFMRQSSLGGKVILDMCWEGKGRMRM